MKGFAAAGSLTDQDSDPLTSPLWKRLYVVANVQDVRLVRFEELEVGAVGTEQYREGEEHFCVGEAECVS